MLIKNTKPRIYAIGGNLDWIREYISNNNLLAEFGCISERCFFKIKMTSSQFKALKKVAKETSEHV